MRRLTCVSFGAKIGLFESIRCIRKLQLDAHAKAHPMEERTSIGWKSLCQSDAPPHFNPLRFSISIH